MSQPLERADIERALREADNNMTDAARALDTSRRTLQNRMRFYGMPTGKPGRKKDRLRYHGRRKVRRYLPALGLAAAAAIGVAALVKKGTST